MEDVIVWETKQRERAMIQNLIMYKIRESKTNRTMGSKEND